MFCLRALLLMTALSLLILATACGRQSEPEAVTGDNTQTVALPTVEAPTVTPSVDEAVSESEPMAFDEIFANVFDRFDPANFSNPTNIDNEWYPLQPGMQWVYEGITEERGFTIPHRIVFTVTDLTKVINDVRTVVAWVVDYSDEQLAEAELAFYAQDDEGNIWYLGEYPEVYENGRFVEAPAWLAGFKGARAGIAMMAEPRPGMPTYSQGWGPAVNWTDYASVDQVGQQTCVSLDCYDDVMVIAESSLEEVDAFQLKYYARGVGNVRVGWRGDDATRETLELVELVRLGPEEMKEVREAALQLETNAYEISPEVYAPTPRAE